MMTLMDVHMLLQPNNPDVPSELILKHLQTIAGRMSAWLKLLGISSMFIAALWVFTLIGIFFAWLPLWQGILLYQAGNRFADGQRQQKPQELLVALERLRHYFMLSGVVTLFFVALTLVFVLLMWLMPDLGPKIAERYWIF